MSLSGPDWVKLNKLLDEALELDPAHRAQWVEALPPVRDGIHVLQAEDGRSFGHAVLDLLENEQRRLALRAESNSLVHNHYRWEVIGAAWQALFEDDWCADDRSVRGGM